jgi:hypothetical protein
MAGLYKASPARMVRDTGLPAQRKHRAFEELKAAGLVLRSGDWIWVRSRVKYLRTKSPNMAASITGDVSQLDPAHPLRAAFVEEYGEWPWLVEKGDEGWRVLCEGTNGDLALESENPDGSIDPPGQGKGSSSSTETIKDSQIRGEFEDWLEHHEQTTGLHAPRSGTAALREVREMFGARRAESYSVPDLKRATIGAFHDPYRKENGHYGLVSVLRPKKVHDLIEKAGLFEKQKLGRPERAHRAVATEAGACAVCGAEINAFRVNNQSRHCDPCYEERFESA